MPARDAAVARGATVRPAAVPREAVVLQQQQLAPVGAAPSGSPASDGFGSSGGGTFVACLTALALAGAALGLLRWLREQSRRLCSRSYAPHIPPA
jgi:hypothetical protein